MSGFLNSNGTYREWGSTSTTGEIVDSIRMSMKLIPKPEPGAFNGEIIESIHMVDGPFEDWSRVRSLGRARRRRRHRQNIRLYYVPKPGFLKLPDGTMVGHPQTVRAFYATMKRSIDRKSDDLVRNAFYGPRP